MNPLKQHKTMRAIALLIGTIVGAGIFSLPYVFALSGFFIGTAHLIILGCMLIIMMLMYGETILRTKESHQLVGYVNYYLGKRVKAIATFSFAFGLFGALIAYLIIGGKFMYDLFDPFIDAPKSVFIIAFFLLSFVPVFAKLSFRISVELAMVVILILLIATLFVIGIPESHINNFVSIDFKYLLFPYGAVLFSLSGFAAVQDTSDILHPKKQRMKRVIIVSGVISMIFTLLFVCIMIGIFGSNASPDPIADLGSVFGKAVLIPGAIFGILVISTSYIALASMMTESLQNDYHISRVVSLLAVGSVPLIITLLELTNFITTITLVGAVAGGIDGMLILWIYFKARKKGDREPEYSLHIPKTLAYLMGFVFTAGLVNELYFLATKLLG